MFSAFMLDTWIAASVVALAAGAVGFFVVLRGSAFAAHAIPNGAFGGAAGAVLLGVNTLLGLGVFAVAGALGIGWLSRRGRSDVVTALSLTMMLGLGALFLSMSTQYAPAVYSLLFGELLGVSRAELVPVAAMAALSLTAVAALYRPLLLTSLLPDVAAARGVGAVRVDTAFLLLVALATTVAVPVVGALLMFSLMVAPAGAARSLTDKPHLALGLSMLLALGTVWLAIVLSYLTNWPIGFFVGAVGAAAYGVTSLLARAAR